MLSFGSPGAVTRPPMLAVFAVDLAGCPRVDPKADSDDAERILRSWAVPIALGITRIVTQLLSVDSRLEVAVDLWSSRAASALRVPRLLLEHPGPDWASRLADKIATAARDCPVPTALAPARLDSLKGRLLGMLDAAPWQADVMDSIHPAQSPLTVKHRTHAVHKQPLPELLSRTSDKLGELKRMKGMPPSAVRHHLFLVSEPPLDTVEWTGPNPAKTRDHGKRKLFEALLGKDGMAWAGWTDRRVAVSWVPTVPLAQASSNDPMELGPLLACLGGKLFPLPQLCLPESWIPFSSVFGPLRPKRIDRELGRQSVIKGAAQDLPRGEPFIVELGSSTLSLSGRRVGEWLEGEPITLVDSVVLDDAYMDNSESHAPCFLLDSVPEGFPPEMSSTFAHGERTFRVYWHRGQALLLPFAPPAPPDPEALMLSAIEDIRAKADRPTLMVPNVHNNNRNTGCTSPLHRTKLTPAPSPFKPAPEQDSQESTTMQPQSLDDLVGLWHLWCCRSAEDPNLLEHLGLFLETLVPALRLFPGDVADQFLAAIFSSSGTTSQVQQEPEIPSAQTLAADAMEVEQDAQAADHPAYYDLQSVADLSAKHFRETPVAVEMQLAQIGEDSQPREGDNSAESKRQRVRREVEQHMWRHHMNEWVSCFIGMLENMKLNSGNDSYDRIQIQLLCHAAALRISRELGAQLPAIDDRREGRRDRKKKSKPPKPSKALLERIEGYMTRLSTELALYDPAENASPIPINLRRLASLLEGSGLEEGPRWADEILTNVREDQLEDSPAERPDSDKARRKRKERRERKEKQQKQRELEERQAKEMELDSLDQRKSDDSIAVTVVPVALGRQEPPRIARTSSQSSQSLSLSHGRRLSQSQNADSASSHLTTGSNLTESSFLRHQMKQRGGIGGGSSRLLQIEMSMKAGSGRTKGRGIKDERRKVERGRVERPTAIGGLVGTAKSPFKPLKMAVPDLPKARMPPNLLVPETPMTKGKRKGISSRHTPQANRDLELDFEARRHTPTDFANRLRAAAGPELKPSAKPNFSQSTSGSQKRKDRDASGTSGELFEPIVRGNNNKASRLSEDKPKEEAVLAKVRRPKNRASSDNFLDDMLGM